MDDLNLFHVLADNIQDIGNGVRLCGQDNVQSKTLVCFLDRNGEFHFGFGFRNGSNLRVVCWENNSRRNRTALRGTFIIAFDEGTTKKGFKANFNQADFPQWFNEGHRDNVKEELRALNEKRDRVADLIERIAGLTIQQIDEVKQKIDELKNN